MNIYKIVFAKSAIKDIEIVQNPFSKKIFLKIEQLADNPRPIGCIKLKGEDHKWRIRIGDYRVVYSIYDNLLVIDIIGVKHRKDIYR